MQIEENKEFRPKIVAFCCNWCSYAGADLAGTNRLNYPADIKIIRVPCSCRKPDVYTQSISARCRRRYYVRLPSRRLPLYNRKLLCKTKNDSPFLNA